MTAPSSVACAIVEPRNHCALLDTVANVHASLGCGVDLFHGEDNVQLAKHVRDGLPSGAVTLHQLPVKGLTTSGYSDLLMTSQFWDQLRAANPEHSHVLIFQTDSGVCAPLAAADSALRAALQHEYCGAPWPPQNDPQVGNGGFSLRDIDATRRLLLSRRQVPKGSEVPEDLFFSRHLDTCPRETAVRFSAETSYQAGGRPPMGFHAWWKYYPPPVLTVCPQAAHNHFLNAFHETQESAIDALAPAR